MRTLWDRMPAWQKWLVGTVAAVVVQGLLQLIWSAVMSPALTWLRDAALNVATLGIQSLKDATYRKVAQGRTDIHMDALFFIVAIGALSLVFLFASGDLMESLERRMENDRRARLAHRLLRINRTAMYYAFLLVVSAMISVGVQAAYAAEAVTRYRMLKAAVAPHSDAAQLLLWDSKLAQVRTSQDFNALYAELAAVADGNGVRKTDFVPW